VKIWSLDTKLIQLVVKSDDYTQILVMNRIGAKIMLKIIFRSSDVLNAYLRHREALKTMWLFVQ